MHGQSPSVVAEHSSKQTIRVQGRRSDNHDHVSFTLLEMDFNQQQAAYDSLATNYMVSSAQNCISESTKLALTCMTAASSITNSCKMTAFVSTKSRLASFVKFEASSPSPWCSDCT